MEHVFIRLNGRGNAWPVFIGSKNPFYNPNDPDDLGNVSYSVFGSRKSTFDTSAISWELLIDAGNNTASYLIRNENRIPDAIILTHPHMDHTLGVDWIAQSYVHLNNYAKRYPLYATLPCWEDVRNSYRQLNDIIEFHEIVPGIKTLIKEVPGMFVTPYPVYHGDSAFGASLLLLEYNSPDHKTNNAAFSGDMLTPLIRERDYPEISKASVLYADCNNRFPYPLSNHESISTLDPRTGKISPYVTDWKKNTGFKKLMAPHLKNPCNTNTRVYLEEFVQDTKNPNQLMVSVNEFVKKTGLPLVKLLHYGGNEDKQYYSENFLSDLELEKWANENAVKEGLHVNFKVPKTGDLYQLL